VPTADPLTVKKLLDAKRAIKARILEAKRRALMASSCWVAPDYYPPISQGDIQTIRALFHE
jgi:hypothetical protein